MFVQWFVLSYLWLLSIRKVRYSEQPPGHTWDDDFTEL